jgi:anti-sigma28 factor (negative regulator of flagellin synthesis)
MANALRKDGAMNLATRENLPGHLQPTESILQRQLRVARLRRLVATGQYKVNLEAVAEALIERGALTRLN